MVYVREYAREFPAEVTGVALIESSSPDQLDEVPGFRAEYEEDKRDAKRELSEDRLRVWSGWERLIGDCSVQSDAKLFLRNNQSEPVFCMR